MPKKPTIFSQPFNGLFSRTTWLSMYQKGKTNLDFTGARDSEWQWHQLGHMQVCTSLQTDNHASTPPLCFLQTGCPSCCPTNSIKALKAHSVPKKPCINIIVVKCGLRSPHGRVSFEGFWPIEKQTVARFVCMGRCGLMSNYLDIRLDVILHIRLSSSMCSVTS